MREEKEALTEQLQTFTMRHQNVEEVIKRLEDREKVLQTALQTIEKEAQLRQQAGEMHKRKATETIQQAQELTYKCEEIQKQLKEVLFVQIPIRDCLPSSSQWLMICRLHIELKYVRKFCELNLEIVAALRPCIRFFLVQISF